MGLVNRIENDMKLPKTHIKLIEEAKVLVTDVRFCKPELLGSEITVKLHEIGIRYHNNRYTPETAYFVSVDGHGSRFTGKTALMRARFAMATVLADVS